MNADALYVFTRDLEIGLARRDCPHCGGPLSIRVPTMASALNDRKDPAVGLGFWHLSRSQHQLFDSLYEAYPRAVEAEVLRLQQSDLSSGGLRALIFRLRKKLAIAGWRIVIQQRDRTYRLLEPPDHSPVSHYSDIH